jgi:putative holliday junction resolvase
LPDFCTGDLIGFILNTAALARILAIDYGKKRTGLAVTDPLQIIATGLDTVETDHLMAYLDGYFNKEKVEKLLIGYPTHTDGSPMELTTSIEHFIKQFTKRFPAIPIQKEDERMTSKMAVQAMVTAGLGKMKRRDKKLIDKVSATLILQNYLQK